jgi:leucyl aminopeptidase
VTAFLQSGTDDNAKPIFCVTKSALDEQLKALSERDRQWLASTGFKAGRGEIRHLPDASGNVAAVVLGLGEHFDMWAWGDLAAGLSAGSYRIATELGAEEATSAALAWALGTYRFTRYRESDETFASLVVPAHADAGLIDRTVTGTFLARDLINTPAQDMGPAELASAAETLARAHGATFRCVVGDELLDKNYPAIHAVGRAAARAPRLIDLTWGNADAPKVTLVGKGVCFDTGGLDLKPSAAMLKMKKDMGGSATMMGLASMIMDAGLPVRLRLLIPAVENAVSGDAYRPGDILKTRKGLTVEVGNTDAEGRIVLCDALADADDEKPALMFDCATLTGAARVALGPDLPALFTDNRDLAEGLERHGETQGDPLWRLPLYAPYAEKLKSKVADMNNVSDGPFAGAITAALYLKAFVSQTESWAHIDTYAWNDAARPGRPAGGEPLGLRSLYAYIAEKFG